MVRMNVRVLMSSGESDYWEDVDDALEVAGALYVVSSTGEDPGKVLRLQEERPDGSVAGVDWEVEAIYAPGMWMKMEFE